MPVSSVASLMCPALTAAILLMPASLGAQAAPSRDTVTIAPNPDYSAGGLHRFFFGTRYRALWTTPIKVPVLDLNRYGGGLTPTQRGGGEQTKSLRFRAADGKEYQFRSVDKNPTGILPENLRNTFAADLLQDQMSAGHPAGSVIVPALLEAAGVLHPTPVLVVMPDDPKLGEHRKEFAGLLGTIEERPRGGESGVAFEGATEVESTDDLYKALDKDPTVRVDSHEYLLARLTDIFMGDWDRHRDQWRWALMPARSGQGRVWRPIPRDRDQVFVRYDGFMLQQARRTAPQLLNFGREYGDIVAHTWNGRDLDRRFLSDVPRPVYDSLAALLKSRLTDQAISNAVSRMPPEWRPLDANRLASALVARRDRLDVMARRYYRLLADRVDIWASDRVDEAKVTRNADGTTDVTLTADGTTYYRRRFDPRETGEIRIYLQGGNDRLTVEGESRSEPTVRAIGGGGDDRYTITARSGVKLYDENGENKAEGSGINTKTWDPPRDTLKSDPAPRDWGQKTLAVPLLAAGPDVGVLVGWGGNTRWYGFRHLPSASRAEWSLLYSTTKKSGRVNLGLTFYGENSKSLIRMKALASGIEVLRWYGFGNETLGSDDNRFHRLNQQQLGFNLDFGYRWSDGNEFVLGPLVTWSNTDLDSETNRDRFIADDAPYGTEKFGMTGFSASLKLDSRDIPKFATRGARLELKGMVVPELWDAATMFGVASAEGSISLAPGGSWQPSLNLMAGGAKTFGDSIPFFEAPSLGGFRTLRGYQPYRFSGESSVYGSAEARIPVTRIRFFVPGQQGIFGFADAGRVYVDGEDSNELHTSFGGGIWLSFVERGNVLVAGVGVPSKTTGGEKEKGRFFLMFGFPY